MWLRSITNPTIRTRRIATSSFFIATFAASILTVSLSASSILPCPANRVPRGTSAQAQVENEYIAREATGAEEETIPTGQKVLLTSKRGWIQIEQPIPSKRLQVQAVGDKA
ncbi:hypothetical protein NDA14_001624 [Ustilago hordei]|nr:hypothetical protein NDA14_001624 [Ustilago hordei]UTT91199.1 hypothetical protein NDA17_004318 [Ustilago hordei]